MKQPGRFSVFRVGSGYDRPPVQLGRFGTLKTARSRAKGYLRSLYSSLPTREGTEFDVWTQIRDRGRLIEEIYPGHGTKYPFVGSTREPVTEVLDAEVYFRRDKQLASLKDDA